MIIDGQKQALIGDAGQQKEGSNTGTNSSSKDEKDPMVILSRLAKAIVSLTNEYKTSNNQNGSEQKKNRFWVKSNHVKGKSEHVTLFVGIKNNWIAKAASVKEAIVCFHVRNNRTDRAFHSIISPDNHWVEGATRLHPRRYPLSVVWNDWLNGVTVLL